LWLFDGRGGYGGFAAIPPGQIVADGQWHEILVDLSRFRPMGNIHAIAFQVCSSDEGQALLEIEKLDFVGPPPRAEKKGQPETRDLTRYRGAFTMNKEIPVNLECPPVDGHKPIAVKTVRFSEKDRNLHCLVRIEGATIATATFAVRVKLFSQSYGRVARLGSRGFTFKTQRVIRGRAMMIRREKDLDFGPMRRFAAADSFEVEIEDVTGNEASPAVEPRAGGAAR